MGFIGDYIGNSKGGMKGDTRSLDYNPYITKALNSICSQTYPGVDLDCELRFTVYSPP